MKSLTFLIVAASFFVSSCASGPRFSTTATPAFHLRPYQEETLPNGLKLIFITETSLPRVSFELMVKTGTASEPQSLPGLHAMATSLLDQGTKTKKALEIADSFAQIGVDFSAMPAPDYTFLTASGLSIYATDALKLFSEVVMTPSFDRKELERLRAQRIAEIAKSQDQPHSFADEMFDREVYGSHPYSNPVVGTKDGIRKMKRDDLAKYYEKHFRPGNSMLAVVGAVDDNIKAEVRKIFGAWPIGAPLGVEKMDPPDSPNKNLKLVSKRDLKQTQIRIGHLGIRRNDPDFMPLRIANLVLGGSFSSRLNQRVRDDLGLTYSIHSASDPRLDRGSFEISTFTRNEKAGETIKETLAVLDEFVQRGITENELNSAKALMIGQFPASIETPDRLAATIMVLRRYGIEDDYLRNYNQIVSRVTVKDVNDAIRKHINPEKLKIVVYADRSQVMAGLKNVGSWTIEEIK